RHLLPILAPQLCCPPSVKVHSFRRPGIRLVAEPTMSAHDRPQFKVSLLKLSGALAGNPESCAAQRLFEYPFFGLAKTRPTMPIIYGFNRIAIGVGAVTHNGTATIWNAELLLRPAR